MDTALIKRWRAIEVILERARAELGSPDQARWDQFDRAIADYQHYISHSEFGLAFEALISAAKLAPCRGGVWKDLIRAAELMNLNDVVPELEKRFAATREPDGRDS